jgi:hypothetical protein
MLVEAQQESQISNTEFETGQEVSISPNVDPKEKFTGKVTEVANSEIKIVDSYSGKEWSFNAENLLKSGDWNIEKVEKGTDGLEANDNSEEENSREMTQGKTQTRSRGLER